MSLNGTTVAAKVQTSFWVTSMLASFKILTPVLYPSAEKFIASNGGSHTFLMIFMSAYQRTLLTTWFHVFTNNSLICFRKDLSGAPTVCSYSVDGGGATTTTENS